MDKDAFIKLIVTDAVDPTESQTLTDRGCGHRPRHSGGTGTDTERGTKNGKPYTVVYRYTVTYILRNG